MKRKNILTFLCLICVTLCFAGNDLFEKYAGKEEVINFTVPKSMLQLIPDIDANGFDIKRLRDNIETVEIYTTQSAAISAEMTEDFKNLVPAGYTRLIQDNKSNTIIWVKEKGEAISEFVAVTDINGTVGVVRILGLFTADDIQQTMK